MTYLNYSEKTYQNYDALYTVCPQLLEVFGKITKMCFVDGEIPGQLHVVYISMLHVLYKRIEVNIRIKLRIVRSPTLLLFTRTSNSI